MTDDTNAKAAALAERISGAPVLAAQADADTQAAAALLLEAHGAEAIAAAFVAQFVAQEEATRRKPARDEKKPSVARDDFAECFWVRLSLGHDRKAEARWLLPMLLTNGQIEKSAVGAIRVRDEETFVQLDLSCENTFFDAIGESMMLEDNIEVTRLEGEPNLPSRGPRPGGGRSDHRGGDRGGYKGGRDGDRGGYKGGYKGKRDDDRGGYKGGYKGKRDDDRGGYQGGYKGKRDDDRGGYQGGYKGKRDDDRGGYQGGYKGKRDDDRGGYKGGYKGKRDDDRGGDKPYGGKPKSFGDKPKPYGDKPRKDFGDKPKGKGFAKPGGKPGPKPAARPNMSDASVSLRKKGGARPHTAHKRG